MAEEHTQPIIVKKIKKGGHGHHGGAWKIAYADFVTAMMAFFLLMWLLGYTTPAEREGIANYFNNPTAVEASGGSSSSVIKAGGGKDVTYSAGETKDGSNAKPRDTETTPEKKAEAVAITQADKQRLDNLKKEVEQAIDASQTLKPFKDQIMLEITKEGLRIQIIDKENRPMFASGSPVLLGYAEQLLREIGKVINHVPNKISLSGHTDATPFSSLPGGEYSNWELSADRSNASRRALIAGGMDEGKVARVVGLSSAVLFDKQNPLNPVNRRISIIVLNKETEDAILHDEGTTSPGTAATTIAPAASKAPEKPVAAATTAPAATAKPTPAPSPAPASPAPATKPAPSATAPAGGIAPVIAPVIGPPTPPASANVPAAASKAPEKPVAAATVAPATTAKPTPAPSPAPASPAPATKPAPSATVPVGGITPIIAPVIGPVTPIAPETKR